MLGHQENESQFSFSTMNAPPQKHVFKIKKKSSLHTLFHPVHFHSSTHLHQLTPCICAFSFGGGAGSMWDLSSLTRDRTHPFHWKHGILTESMGLPGKPLIPCIFKYQPVCDGEEHLFRAFLDELSSSNGKEFACNAETCVQSLGWEDPLGEGMATHSSILAWRIPWTKEPGGLQSMGLQRVRHDGATFTLFQYVMGNSMFLEPSLVNRSLQGSFAR